MVAPSRRALLAALALPAGLAGARARAGDAYPDRPVTLVVPFSTGGAADLAARALAGRIPAHLPGASLLVENRPGASGAVGTQAVARARPDGHTLLLARTAPSAILPAIDPRTPYAWDEFTMLGLLEQTPFVVCVRADSPWDSFGALLGALREAPGQLRFATSGPATLLDLGIRQIFAATGLPLDAGLALPFRGGGEAVAAVLDGSASFLGTNLSDAREAIAAGRLRALVVGTSERMPQLPGVPSAPEAEVAPLTQITGWSGVFGPPGMPEGVTEAWSLAIAALGRDAAWLAAVRRVGGMPRLLGPPETRDFLRDQVALYRELARRLGLI